MNWFLKKGKRRNIMKRDTRFKKKFQSNNKVKIGNDGRVWTVCNEAYSYSDDSKHVMYLLSRGAWKKYVRGDKMKMA